MKYLWNQTPMWSFSGNIIKQQDMSSMDYYSHSTHMYESTNKIIFQFALVETPKKTSINYHLGPQYHRGLDS